MICKVRMTTVYEDRVRPSVLQGGIKTPQTENKQSQRRRVV